MADRRSPVAHMYSVLRRQHPILCDDNAPAARPDGRTTGRTNENDAMDDVPHAGNVLLHVQRLLGRFELLLFHFSLLQCRNNVGFAQDDKR